jgi:hypothetical protein
MKITNCANTDSGYVTLARKAITEGRSYESAKSAWRWQIIGGRKRRRNSLWIKHALIAYWRLGGYIPKEELQKLFAK